MRRFFQIFFVVMALSMAFDASAQQVVKKRIGVYQQNGNVEIAEATTTLVIDLVVEREQFVAGPYARYAQKYLGNRASLVDKDEYRLVSAEVAVLRDEAYFAEEATIAVAEPQQTTQSMLSVDRMSASEKSAESLAKDAADKIFMLRRSRFELVTGDFGDGVYGAGLESALREMDKMERELLAMFYGTTSVTQSTERIIYPVNASQTTSVIARLSATSGIVEKNDLSGEIIMVVITPSQMEYPASAEKGKVAYRYANNAEVVVALGQQVVARRILPLYEFGQTVMFLQPSR
jgi:hypothetical protein